ncbi:unnamed protein product [Spirodela intermedia]|uniref:Uncharacterized protein n=1 Tax=Spirodela intermedia TaxID=51605 RepID=A0A7I8L0V0_SPIIN|nr:unnamed protein product [Spirodela intermedia]
MEEPSPPSQASLERAGNAPASFYDSDNCSSVCYSGEPESLAAATPDAAALRLLSDNLKSLFLSPELAFCADARICVVSSGLPSPREVAVHRCLLSARSPFFRQLFAGEKEKEKFDLRELVTPIDVGYDALVAVLAYIYTGRVGPLPDGVCDCVDEQCPHVACRPAVDFLVQVLYASFTFQIAELVSLYQRHLLEILEKVESDDVPVILSAASSCDRACERLLARCVEVVTGGDLDVVSLEKTLPPAIVKQVLESRRSSGPEFPDKHTRRIHRALDSDDVELVRMLLTEGHVTLDDACALHYAVAYCDGKTTMELLEIGVADVNRRNHRGLTVLHVAAMRKEPHIIVSLLTKGANTRDLTGDGRNALQIAKRLTTYAEYYRETGEGMPSPKDKLCIEILEQAERRAPQPGEASVTLAIAGEDARTKLLYLENRVALARLLFPMEAKVAMDIAQVDATLEFTLCNGANLGGNKRSRVDLNETPFSINKEHFSRLRALSKTVELGKRFFPRCSKVLDKIMDDEEVGFGTVWTATEEEQFLRKRRFQELQDIVGKAFSKDKQENDRSAFPPSSSASTAIGGIRAKPTRK